MSKDSNKTLVQAISYALLFYFMLFIVFAFVKLHSVSISQIEVILQMPEPATNPLTKPVSHKVRPVLQKNILPVDVVDPPSQPKAISAALPVDTVHVDSFKKFDRITFFTHDPFRQPIEKIETDSVDTLLIQPLIIPLLNPKDTTQFSVLPGPQTDRIQQDIDQQNLGHPRPLPLTNAIGQGAKYVSDLFDKKKDKKPVRLDFVPNEAELDILETLWEKKTTDQQIYTALDTSIRLTAVDLNSVMEKLEKKGLVKRKLVSPRNEFTFPVGQVEMSAKNRRNRVYLYESRIDSKEVLRYLQAVLYEAEFSPKSMARDSTHMRFVASLKAKILRLLEKSG